MKIRFLSFVLVFSLLCSGCFYSKSDIEAARSDAYAAGYRQGMEDSSAFYTESDLELAYDDGYYDGQKEARQEFSVTKKPDIDDVLDEAAVFATKETSWTFYDIWNDVMEYTDEAIPENSSLNSWEKAVLEHTGKTSVPNSILRKVSILVDYCMYLDEYESYYKIPITDRFE
ncbi:MAG: hypothetical protein J6V25_09155 [Oscillospiraceae bacterium]|nr:hypothetical protein [Oscillospiraceae bacterium]